MSNRPLGITLLCAFFGLIGLGSLVSMTSATGYDVPPGQPESVGVFLMAYPFVMFILGTLGLVAAVTLWVGHTAGRTSGLAWLGLWVLEELAIGVWGLVGPEVIREVSSGFGSNLIRILVGLVAFYYLWTVGARYVEPLDRPEG
jgi:hypothetical protein